MADFNLAYKKTARSEGGYTDNSSDNGNWTGGIVGSGYLIGTKYGISAPRLMEYLGRVPTVAEMKNLQPSTAKAIMKIDYWDVVRGDEIKDQASAEQIFDAAINSGPSQSVKLAQRTLGLSETGHMDTATLNALNNVT